MPLVVSDNSPLNLLVRIGRPDVLPALFGRVLIPPEVAREMGHPKAPDPVRQFIAAPPSWLEIRPPTRTNAFPTLDPGESAAINLAVELGAVLLIDERDGRAAAAALGIPVIGAIGVLERAAEGGLIADLATVYNAVRSQRFHVSEVILRDSLARIERNRNSQPPKGEAN
jgi:predicted nucleic acid-binding protein